MRMQKLSEITGISKRNIHFYIKEGLLSPKSNTSNGYYDFSESDSKQLILIRYFRDLEVPLSDIKSLLENPASTEYFLRMHISRLEQEIEMLSQNRHHTLSILDQLPTNPNFDDLYNFTSLPSNYKEPKPLYDGKLVNHFLWRTFLQKEELSEYQQYLWDKINRLTDTRDKNEYYAKVYDYLAQQEPKKINTLYHQRNAHFIYVAKLTDDEIFIYVEEIKHNLAKFIDNPIAINQWKEHYHSFFVPQIYIYTGKNGELAKEMSPFFASYQKNSSKACKYIYEWLTHEDGRPLRDTILNTLDGFINLENYNHAELESINTVIKYLNNSI